MKRARRTSTVTSSWSAPSSKPSAGSSAARAHQCKACSLRKKHLGERVNTRWYCQACSLDSKKRNRPRPRFGHAIQMRATAAKQRHKRRRPTAGQDDEGTVAATAGDKNGADRGEDGDESHGVVTAAV
ncbi:hypothetical protein PC128_g23979 [Phytophthora cactorum]|nr:hypothetical protein PC128_g23979 [Phytophthora cactorum]